MNKQIIINTKYFYFGVRKENGTWEIHHLYYGIVLTILGIVFNLIWMWVVGLILAVDDLYQHHKQGKDKSYQSPINKLYGLSGIENLRNWLYLKTKWEWLNL